MSIKQRIEDNIAIWMLGALLTGFLSGIAAYKAIQEIAGIESVPKAARVALEESSRQCSVDLQQAKKRIDELDVGIRTANTEAAACKRSSEERRVRAPQPVVQAVPSVSDPTKSNAVSNSDLLKGASVTVHYLYASSNAVARIKMKLEAAGVDVQMKHLPYKEEASVAKPGEVLFHNQKSMPIANAVLTLLKPDGFTRTVSRVNSFSGDVLIWVGER